MTAAGQSAVKIKLNSKEKLTMKKALTLFLASMMILSFAACGENNTDSSSSVTENSVAETTEAATEESTEEATEEDTAEDTQEPSEEENIEADNGAASGDTIGQTLLADFISRAEADPSMSAQAMADAILTNPVIQFGGATMPVENGLLTGFDNAEITGFSEGVMFAPMIGTIPFVGYVFTLEDGADVEAFVQTLESSANPRWNICTAADETIVESSGNTVFFLMCPSQFEE